ncbi:Bifunctional decalin synthase calF [Cladobotryum mycophilum]|uniref:Bifunctional decalin synthase calF n=1 Tax=Cladobotryum mycophilum TaxID=491253 RepID=A0ABR0SIM1_9HYPO
MKASLVYTATLIPVISALAVANPRGYDASCKPIPGDTTWPTQTDWAKLNQTVGGRLIATVPLANVCHTAGISNYNAAACATLKTQWDLPQTHLFSPSEIMAPYFQNQSCDPFTSTAGRCDLGNYASFSIKVTGADDVAAGLSFVKKHNIRLVIKNTGHDYLGKSTGKGSLSLWTHGLDSVNVIPHYVGSTYKGPALKMGSGTLAGTAYTIAHNHGYQVIGGTCPTVGLAGGYTQGGGHSLLSSRYGLAADNVLEWEVVTAQGEHLVATPTKNADLYWALSGGGGGTYAVVLSLTTKLHPDGPVGGAGLTFNDSTVGNDNFWLGVSDWFKAMPAFVDGGNTALYELEKGIFTAYAITAPDCNATQVAALLAPFLSKLKSRGIAYTFTPTSSPSFLDHFEHYLGPLPYGSFPVSQITSSRLIPRSTITNPRNSSSVMQALRTATRSGNFYLGCHAAAVSGGDRSGGNNTAPNAVLPAWRDALAHCIVVGPWDWKVPRSQMLAREDELTNVITPALEAATPGSGTYLNEANFAQKGWQKQFYGSNYNRLRSIKGKYDPQNVFYAVTAVGSEAYVVDGSGRLCKA